MDIRQALGARVRRQRMALGLTQAELAAQTEIPYQVLSRVEHGRQSLYFERLAHLALALGVSTDFLVGLTDTPRPRRRLGKPEDHAKEEAA